MCGIAGIRRFDGAPVDDGHPACDDITPRASRAGCGRLLDERPDRLRSPQAVHHRPERLGPADGVGRRIVPHHVQRRDPELPRAAGARRLSLSNQRRHRDHPRLLHGTREAVVGDLEGQFAFALHDARDNSLLLARDRMGILPLYYYVDARCSPSPPRSRRCSRPFQPPRWTRAASMPTLAGRAVPAPYTLFDGVRKLPPAHTLRVGERGIEGKDGTGHSPRRRAEDCAAGSG